MTLARLAYRASQFWKFLAAKPSAMQLLQARQVLSPAQLALFERMQPGEQAHSLLVMEKILAQGDAPVDLLVAALLHDVGKSRFRLTILERVWIVIMKKLTPQLAYRWGQASPGGTFPRWKRAFLVAEMHPQWGAEMALAAGVSQLAARLISRHQEAVVSGSSLEDVLLRRLQCEDDEN